MNPASQWKLADRGEMPVHTFLMPPGESVPLEIIPFADSGSLAQSSFPHRHTFYEILHVTGGRGTHVVDFESHPIRPPALWFISPGQVHYWNTTQPLQGQALLFTGEFLRVAAGSEAGVRELAFFHRLEGTPELRLKGRAENDIDGVFQQLADEYRTGAVGRGLALRAWLQILLIKAQRLYAPQKPGAGSADSAALARRFKQLDDRGHRWHHHRGHDD